MSMSVKISAIILTFNEELHIERCIKSIIPYVDDIHVVDSFSEDKTLEIARQMGVKVYQNPFVNQAVQFNWALENCLLEGNWILRIDADEFIDNRRNIDLAKHIENLPKDVDGLHISRRISFMGKAFNYGTWYPKWNLRVFKKGKGYSEVRWMDEHIVLKEGRSEKIWLDFVDDNLNDLTWWTNKHNNYSNREVADYFFQLQKEESEGVRARMFGNEAERKRWLKKQYHKLPFFIRPLLNFVYRYIFRLGFLDGKQGLIWHFLQGFWYRMLVDAKIWELKRRFNKDNNKIITYLKQEYNL